ncbi:MAG: transcription termination factor NusA [Clostridiales Family XIII bacterium]|jgi:N utilization substance protein A|nr:transcription termination factor NusA [Clostridiales Family XIII bacterium]
MNKEFISALDQIEKEKNIPKSLLLDAVSRALISAYKGKNKANDEELRVEIDEKTGVIDVLRIKTVVEEITDPENEVSLEEMREYDDSYEVGDQAEFPYPVEEFSRIAAQTAKQVVVQAIRDAERSMIFEEYKDRQGELITGTIQRAGSGPVYVTLGRTEGIMPLNEQIRGEKYTQNARMKFYILEVRNVPKGPQIFLSRTHPNLVRKLFELEVPEIRENIVSIESLAREAGSRTKMGVLSTDESVDPVGACVGNRGNRVQAVVEELGYEKIDIIPWVPDNDEANINSALAPAGVEKIVFDSEENKATAIVPDYQLSLAIGKEGQNVRLAARLCGVKIDIKSHTQYYGDGEAFENEAFGVELDEEGFYKTDSIEDTRETAESDGQSEQ